MRIVFMGTPPFAVPALRALAASHEVVAVYTRPDKPAGRGRRLVASAVKEAAEELGLRVLQPPTLKDTGVVRELESLAPDVIVVAAYGVILPPDVLAVPRVAPINIHASLLPRWRGAAPVQHAILAGDELAGVSIMRMTEGLDTGPYCLQRAVEVDDHTAVSLTAELGALGAAALLDALTAVADGTVVWTEQDDASATYATKITREDLALSPALTVVDAYRRIRASSPQAAARACVAGTDITVTEASLAPEHVRPGSVHAHGRGLVLGFADGGLDVLRLTPQGRGTMDGAAFARGARLPADAHWSACRAR